MEETSDFALLQAYVQGHSEAAFASIITRHIELVYSAALRQVRSPHLAEEITQATFIILAHKAKRFSPGVFLPTWLLRTVRYAALSELRTGFRRQRYEKEAQMELLMEQDGDPNPSWEEVAPLLDEAMSKLSEKDRQAVVLRFFERKTLREVGSLLGIDEDTAQKRVSRALDRMRRFMTKRGMAISGLTLATLVSVHAVKAAPVGLVASVTSVAATSGTAASLATTALIKSALKYSVGAQVWTKIKAVMTTGAGLALAASLATVAVREIREYADPVRTQVLSIVQTNQWIERRDDAELAKLAAIGPRALPTLAELLEWRQTIWNRQYQKVWSSLPDSLRHHLRDPALRKDLQRKARQIVWELGPAAARPLTSALCQALSEPGFKHDLYALRCLYWSIPESAQAVAALTNYLGQPSQSFMIFGMLDANELWPHLPQAVPWLTLWLSNPYAAEDAARGLGALGAKASSAIPALLEVSSNGIAGTPLDLVATVNYPSPLDPYLRNRRYAFETLGQIGVSSDEVLEAFRRGIEDDAVRVSALQGLVALGPPSRTGLDKMLDRFPLPNSFRTRQLIDAIGALGAQGEWALPWLRKFASLKYVEELPPADPELRDPQVPPAQLVQTALLAICRIAPNEIGNHIPDLISQLSGSPVALQLLATSKSLSPKIMDSLDPLLNASELWLRIVAAEIMLGHSPNNPRPIAVLRNLAAQGKLSDRQMAAQRLWRTTGETNGLLPLLIQGLGERDSLTAQAAAMNLAELGPAARSAVPALQAALWHPDRYARVQAGKTLRKIAPEHLPPIR